jgi:hypothetical protein
LHRHSPTPFLTRVETFPDGEVLFDHCAKVGFEGIVSKCRQSGYASGPRRHWSRSSARIGSASTRSGISCSRDRANPSRRKHRKTLAKKREELARVIERRRSPLLSHGIARELRKQQAILEREFTELSA